MGAHRITANLPSRDFSRTEAFYARLGFKAEYRSDGWMILSFGSARVEFFAHPELEPKESWFSACLRSSDIDAMRARFAQAGLPEDNTSIPRLTGFF